MLERGGELRLQLALPGVEPGAVSVAADAGGIVVSAIRGFPCREGDAQIHRIEIPYGRFERRIALPEATLVAKELKDGILTLTFRRKEGK